LAIFFRSKFITFQKRRYWVQGKGFEIPDCNAIGEKVTMMIEASYAKITELAMAGLRRPVNFTGRAPTVPINRNFFNSEGLGLGQVLDRVEFWFPGLVGLGVGVAPGDHAWVDKARRQ
jgi:hypothetical protein